MHTRVDKGQNWNMTHCMLALEILKSLTFFQNEKKDDIEKEGRFEEFLAKNFCARKISHRGFSHFRYGTARQCQINNEWWTTHFVYNLGENFIMTLRTIWFLTEKETCNVIKKLLFFFYMCGCSPKSHGIGLKVTINCTLVKFSILFHRPKINSK